ncbi:MAG: heavy-metal-associated domain-containing protein [Wenzhouxiangella sp.]|nr:MAG: heavy-metal-associated domain-containing protein [Wenzhouxiangella sp.]
MTMLKRTLVFLALLLITSLALAERDNDNEAVTLSIPNMVCMSCEMRIDQALLAVDGVVATRFDLDAKTVTVHFNADVTSSEALTEATEAIGYPATIVSSPTEAG